MGKTNYAEMYEKIYKIIGKLTPLKADCGTLCGCACCKGDENLGMRLFPYEETFLPVKTLENGVKLVVCSGQCKRENRPLACRIFPFFPTVDDRGRVYVEADFRGVRLCPMIAHSEEIVFDKRFFKALKKAGKILAKDEKCLEFLKESTDEIDMYHKFLGQ